VSQTFTSFDLRLSVQILFTARRYANAVYAVVVCLFVRSVGQSVTSRHCTKMANNANNARW